MNDTLGPASGVVLRQSAIYYWLMGRFLAILLLIQISLPGFCCIANRVVRSTAVMVGFTSSAQAFPFCCHSCCGTEYSLPNSHEACACCSPTNGCRSPESTSDSAVPEKKQPRPSDEPIHRKICECLDSDPMIPPSMVVVDLDIAPGIYDLNEIPKLMSDSLHMKAARYHPPPIRRHLFLCVIRC